MNILIAPKSPYKCGELMRSNGLIHLCLRWYCLKPCCLRRTYEQIRMAWKYRVSARNL